jgi:hypothetical protein
MNLKMAGRFSVSRTFLIVLFLGLFTMAARNATDPDLWWHLKTGEYISAHRSVPRTDVFSYTRAGQPWVAHEWLTELALYQVQRIAGFAALILLFAAILTAAFSLLYRRCCRSHYSAGVLVLCGALATAPLWGVRPQIVSLFLTSLWLLILERSDTNPKLLWWTLPLTLLWANLHAGFALGLVLSALFLCGGILGRILGRSDPSAPFRLSAWVLFLDLLLVSLNPNGFGLLSYPIETLRSAAMQTYIVEWASPNFHRAEYWSYLLIILATFAVLTWSRRRPRPRDLLLLSASLYASLNSIRLIPLFILIAVPFIDQRLGGWPRPESSSRRPSTISTAFNVAIIGLMVLFAGVHIAQVIHRQADAESRQFPARAVAFLQSTPAAGPIFNHYDWGGYLIWKLYPATPVFIDGRADVYGEALFHDFAKAYELKGGWREVLQRWHVQTVLVPPDSALATGLRSAPGWTVDYQDSQAIILTSHPQAIALSQPRSKCAANPPQDVTPVCN